LVGASVLLTGSERAVAEDVAARARGSQCPSDGHSAPSSGCCCCWHLSDARHRPVPVVNRHRPWPGLPSWDQAEAGFTREEIESRAIRICWRAAAGQGAADVHYRSAPTSRRQRRYLPAAERRQPQRVR